MGGVVERLLTLNLRKLGTMCQALFCLIYINRKEVICIEIWKDIDGYEGYYQVSNLGRIRSLDRIIIGKNGRPQTKVGSIMSDRLNSRINRREIGLRKNDKRKAFKVYRLVAMAFVENEDPINNTTVNHIDGDTNNNVSSNLEWCSYSKNLQHSYDKLNRPTNKPKGKRKCHVYDKLLNTNNVYSSIMETAREIKISETQIRRISNKECVNERYEISID